MTFPTSRNSRSKNIPAAGAPLPLFGQDIIRRRLQDLAAAIAGDFAGMSPVMVGVLQGSFMFMADLARELHARGLSLTLDFMLVSSYGAGQSSNRRPELLLDVTAVVRGRPVLLVDDITDSGHTLEFCVRHLRQRRPALLKTCVLLDKPARRVRPVAADYMAFEVPDAFIVGYGLDYNGLYRELPGLAVLGTAAPAQ